MTKKISNKNDVRKGNDKFIALPKIKYKIGIILLITIFIFYLYKIPVLVARNFFTGDYLKSWYMIDDSEFIIAYTHSVELCPVTETYLIKEGSIILSETYFESYGAGLPSTTPYTFEYKNKGFRIYNINEIMDDLLYRTGEVRANHELIYKDKSYKFLDFSKARTCVEFKIERVSFLAYVVRECLL